MHEHHESLSHKITTIIATATHWLETIIAVVVFIALIVSCVPMLEEMTALWGGSTEEFHTFLSSALNLVVGIEFIEMLVKHNPGSVLEVMLFAIVRHMLVGHGTGLENLLSVAAVGLVFVIRKFAFSPSFGEEIEAPQGTISADEANL